MIVQCTYLLARLALGVIGLSPNLYQHRIQAEPGVGAFKAPMSFALLRSPSRLFPGQIVGLVVDEVGLGT
jgi:hypothetical protein